MAAFFSVRNFEIDSKREYIYIFYLINHGFNLLAIYYTGILYINPINVDEFKDIYCLFQCNLCGIGLNCVRLMCHFLYD